jgi:hypothetical protein
MRFSGSFFASNQQLRELNMSNWPIEINGYWIRLTADPK